MDARIRSAHDEDRFHGDCSKRTLTRRWWRRVRAPLAMAAGLAPEAAAHNVTCLSPHSLQVNGARICPGEADTRFFAPHFPHVASIRVSPCLTVTAFRSIASLTRRSASSRIACFDISRPISFDGRCRSAAVQLQPFLPLENHERQDRRAYHQHQGVGIAKRPF
jgi:hypothetical protein